MLCDISTHVATFKDQTSQAMTRSNVVSGVGGVGANDVASKLTSDSLSENSRVSYSEKCDLCLLANHCIPVANLIIILRS